MTQLRAPGGLVGPVSTSYILGYDYDDIWPNHIAPRWRNRTFIGRLKNFFSWSPDWGCHLRGGPKPRIRDMFPVCTANRGGIRFLPPTPPLA